MEQPPKKPKKLTEKESESFIKSAKGTDISHSLAGAPAAHTQLGKGPEKMMRDYKNNISKFLVKLLEKETIVKISTDKLIEKYERYMNMYENKAKLLSRKENELYTLKEEQNEIKAKIKATKEVDDYIKKRKPELFEQENEKMAKERERLSEEGNILKEKIKELERNIELDKTGLENLKNEIIDLAKRDEIIQLQ